ncbi:MAG: ABC transporter permease [Austwickia sp.]|nr:ABC transporter permease subunit [Austwickia sp.]MCO5309730.1 ABC transporter permease [Austwickia sp.]
MTALLRAELGRIRSRRMTWIIAAIAVGLLALIGYGIATAAAPPSAAEQQRAEQAYQQSKADFEQHGDRMRQDCLDAQTQQRTTDPGADFGCDRIEPPMREHFGKPTPEFSRLWSSAQSPATVFLGFLALLVGGSWVAAEFTTGSMATWLTYEPRRTRVYGAKLLATALAVAGGAVALTGLLLAVTRGAFAVHGVAVELDHNAVVDVWLGAGRMVAFPVLTALGGAALAFLVRHTAAVIGIAIGAIVVDQWAAAQLQDKARWTLFNNVLGFVDGRWQFHYARCAQDAAARYGCESVEETIWFAQAAAVLGGLVAVGLVLAWWQFRRRDVV